MQEIFFNSKLHVKYKSDIERIFFFNKNQIRYHDKIEKSIEVYGIPHIEIIENHIHFTFEKIKSFQYLYAFDDKNYSGIVLGIAHYFRDTTEDMKIIHIAVDDNCSFQNMFEEETIAARLINEVKNISFAIKGIETVTLPYSNYNIYI
jgi:hypothetical protein